MRILIDGQTIATEDFYRGIGTYMRNVLPRLLKRSLTHQFYLLLSEEKFLERLDSWTVNRLHVILSPAAAPGADYIREEQYTRTLEKAIEEHHIDLIWNPNPLMDNVLFPNRSLPCKMFVMIHDVIPLLMPVAEWPEAVTREYHRRLKMIKEDPNICLLFNSEASRKDWSVHIQDHESAMRVTPLAADARKFYHERKKGKSARPYILFTGGFNYRKNIDGALEAFRAAREHHADDAEFRKYRLVIVGSCSRETKERYEQLLTEKGLQDAVSLTGFVSEKQLIQLYREADLFFFPSMYEGFGLPLLEAMLSGDYIVSADNSSLPEVCGSFAEYFSVDRPEQIAEALYRGYRQHLTETEEDIRARQEYALGFSWEKTATQTLEFMEETASPPRPVAAKPSLAIFTPWPNQKTGIANYEYRMIPYLAEYFHVTVFTPAAASDRRPLENVSVLGLEDYPKRGASFDYRLFQIGNNHLYHKEIMDLLMRDGGIAEVHDYVLSPFFYLSYYEGGEKKTYRRLLRLVYGRKDGSRIYNLSAQKNLSPDMLTYPMSEAVVALSDRVIVHNHWSANQLASPKVAVLPLPSFPLSEESAGPQTDSAALDTARTWKREGYLLLGCFGWVNPNKHPEVVLQALRTLRAGGVPVKLLFWGENNVENLESWIADYRVEKDVLLSGYLDRAAYFQALALTDIVINLRHPSMGESSGPLNEAFQAGKAVIVSDYNQYQEYPDDLCWKLPVGDGESEILAAYIRYLAEHPEVREVLGKNAKAFADYALSPAKIARQYYEVITDER